MVRIKDEIRPSSEIDGYCTKCRLVTNHRVVAMVDNVVKRVICLTCDSQHNFRPPPGQKKTSSAPARRVTKDERRVAGTGHGPQPFHKWQEMKAALGEEFEPPVYQMASTYKEGVALNHPTFGLGFVAKVVGAQKMEVMFEREIKLLVMNYIKPQ